MGPRSAKSLERSANHDNDRDTSALQAKSSAFPIPPAFAFAFLAVSTFNSTHTLSTLPYPTLSQLPTSLPPSLAYIKHCAVLYSHYLQTEEQKNKKTKTQKHKSLVSRCPVLHSISLIFHPLTNSTNSSLLLYLGKTSCRPPPSSVARHLQPRLLVADKHGFTVGFQEWRGA